MHDINQFQQISQITNWTVDFLLRYFYGVFIFIFLVLQAILNPYQYIMKQIALPFLKFATQFF